MCGYLTILSFQDICQKKVSVWLLVIAVVSSSIYALVYQGNWRVFLDILPGSILCLIAMSVPKSLGMGDGIVGIIYGLVYGWLSTCICLSLAFVLAAVAGVIVCIGRIRKRIQIPFIPFFALVHAGMHL